MWDQDEQTDDSDDPDYREDSDASDESLPKTEGRKRAAWIEENYEELAEAYESFKQVGKKLWGEWFFQNGSINQYAKLVYKYSTV